MRDGAGAADIKPVVAQKLVKEFGDLVAVRGIDFEVRPGECFGFLGPNGAGKTSTMRMIACASPVTSGSLLVNGLSVQTEAREVKSIIGVVPQGDNLDDEISVIDNLRLYAGYFGINRAEANTRARTALELFQLADRANSKVDELSGGMKRRLLIARGLINEPAILVLDEPTTGLDPQARHLVWRTLRRLKDQGVTMLLTTHYMDEAAVLCDRLIIMHEGQILAEGTPLELIRRIAGETVIEAHSWTSPRLITSPNICVMPARKLSRRRTRCTRSASTALMLLNPTCRALRSIHAPQTLRMFSYDLRVAGWKNNHDIDA